MPTTVKRTISLPSEQSDFIDRKLESGSYSSASEVVRAGLRALQTQDQVFEKFLREDVVPVYERMRAHPEEALTSEELDENIKAHFANMSDV